MNNPKHNNEISQPKPSRQEAPVPEKAVVPSSATSMAVGGPVGSEAQEPSGDLLDASVPKAVERKDHFILSATPRQAEAALNAGIRNGLLRGSADIGVDKVNQLRKDLIEILDASLDLRRTKRSFWREQATATLHIAIEKGWVDRSVQDTPMREHKAVECAIEMLQAAEDAMYLERFEHVRGEVGNWGVVVNYALLVDRKLNPLIEAMLKGFVEEIPGSVISGTDSNSEQICGNFMGPSVSFRVGSDHYRVQSKDPGGNIFELTRWAEGKTPANRDLDRVPLSRIAREFGLG